MANTLTGLIPTLYEALDVVSRELVGFIPSIRLDAAIDRAAQGQTVTSFRTPASTASDLTPAVTPPNSGDQTIPPINMTITKSRYVPVRWTGEEQRSVNNSGPGYRNILQDQFAQAMRTLCNELEADIALEVKNNASRAWGTAGTTPFASDLSDLANIRQILVDNGAPLSDLNVVLNTTAGTKMRSLAQLAKVSEAGSSNLLRQGVLDVLYGMAIRESAQCVNHTKGTGSAYVIDGTGNTAVGSVILKAKTGSGTLVKGDVLAIQSDTNKYCVTADLAATLFTIGDPGLRVASADSRTITIGNNYYQNAAFARTAVVAAVRQPALPEEGDMADDRVAVVDPVSGIAFEVSQYRQFRQVGYTVALSWGVKVVKSEHVATLLG